jgi:nitrogen regulatory protein P-II 1
MVFLNTAILYPVGEFDMKKIEAIIRPLRLEPVKAALAEEPNLSGLTVSDVRGSGRHGGHPVGIYRGLRYVITLPPKIKIELLVPDENVDHIVDVILENARTGEEGDGKIFVLPMGDAIRVRTGDHGDLAVT